jgi:hypothetical protein
VPGGEETAPFYARKLSGQSDSVEMGSTGSMHELFYCVIWNKGRDLDTVFNKFSAIEN